MSASVDNSEGWKECSTWFFRDEAKGTPTTVEGPYSFLEFHAAYDDGRANGDSYVYNKEDIAEWTAVKDLPELWVFLGRTTAQTLLARSKSELIRDQSLHKWDTSDVKKHMTEMEMEMQRLHAEREDREIAEIEDEMGRLRKAALNEYRQASIESSIRTVNTAPSDLVTEGSRGGETYSVQVAERPFGFQFKKNTLQIVTVKPGGPAIRAGVLAGSTVVSVNDKECLPKTWFAELFMKESLPFELVLRHPDAEAELFIEKVSTLDHVVANLTRAQTGKDFHHEPEFQIQPNTGVEIEKFGSIVTKSGVDAAPSTPIVTKGLSFADLHEGFSPEASDELDIASGRRISVIVNTPKGSISLEVQPTDSIKSVKNKIAASTSVPSFTAAEQQVILYETRRLKDEATIGDYRIEPNVPLDLVGSEEHTPGVWRVCEYCNESLPKRIMLEHRAKCDEVPVDCSFSCGARVAKKDMTQHLTDNVVSHVSRMREMMVMKDREIGILRKQLSDTQTRLEALAKFVASTHSELRSTDPHRVSDKLEGWWPEEKPTPKSPEQEITKLEGGAEAGKKTSSTDKQDMIRREVILKEERTADPLDEEPWEAESTQSLSLKTVDTVVET